MTARGALSVAIAIVSFTATFVVARCIGDSPPPDNAPTDYTIEGFVGERVWQDGKYVWHFPGYSGPTVEAAAPKSLLLAGCIDHCKGISQVAAWRVGEECACSRNAEPPR